MWKLKTFAIITIILGLISLGWLIYDYLALTDIVYNYGVDQVAKRRMVTLGFIPILLFHFSFFATMYFLFDFLKNQKVVIKEHKQFKLELDTLKSGKSTKDKVLPVIDSQEKEIKIEDRGKPTIQKESGSQDIKY